MARDPARPLLMTVLDRLLDEVPADGGDRLLSQSQHLARLRAAIRRDLEALLNTRQRCRRWPAALDELDLSTVGYGIPDFTGLNMATEEQRAELLREIERVIARYEPRFKQVEVVPLANADELDRTLRFRIAALMHAEPAPEPIVFDSVLDPLSRTFSVGPSGDV